MKITHKPLSRIAWIALAASLLVSLPGAQQPQAGGMIGGIARRMTPSAAAVEEVLEPAAAATPAAAPAQTAVITPAPATTSPATAPATGPSALERAKEIGGEAGVVEAAGMGQGPDLFTDQEAIRTLLGENPRWVWHVEPNVARPDPMLIPWVAEKLLFDARDAEAKALIGAGKLAEALELYQRLYATITEMTYRTQVEQRIAELEVKIEEMQQKQLAMGQPVATTQGSQPIVEPVLPQFVQTETRGVIYSRTGGSYVAVGDQMLKEGDEVEGAPGVVVKSIGYQTVVFSVKNEFMTKDFEIKVIGDLVPLQ